MSTIRSLRGVDQRVEEAQVVLALEPGTARHELAVEVLVAARPVDRLPAPPGEQLVRLAYQSLRKTRSGGDGGPSSRTIRSCHFRPRRMFDRVVGAVDHVLRAHEADPAVDDEHLAVVAEVGPLVAARKGCTGSIRCHCAPIRVSRRFVAR